jgi:antitoxin (DNA-binding transcriptional repressor) of toxin-antitoxin stability system
MVMFKANVFEVKAKLSEFLDRAARGERIVICRHNEPVAELRAVEGARTEPRAIGPLPDRPTFDVPPSFFEPMADEELDRWEGMGITLTDTPPVTSAPRRTRDAAQVAEPKAEYGGRRRGRRPTRRRR